MLRIWKSKIKKENGQAMVIVALSLVALLGITAFSVDMGLAYSTKAKLQAAADAAALAGAQDLPQAATAIVTATSYAELNGVPEGEVQSVSPYAGDVEKIEVTITQNFNYIFAGVLGFDSKDIVVRAVAQRGIDWAGDALPFMNLDDDYSADPSITLWEATTGPGDYEKLWPKDSDIDPEYIITKTDGVVTIRLSDMEDGFALDSGINASDQKDITTYLNQLIGKEVYVITLRPNLIDQDANYGNKQVIPLSDVMLIKCRVISYDFSNTVNRGIELEYLGVAYAFTDIVSGAVTVPGLEGSGEPVIHLVE